MVRNKKARRWWLCTKGRSIKFENSEFDGLLRHLVIIKTPPARETIDEAERRERSSQRAAWNFHRKIKNKNKWFPFLFFSYTRLKKDKSVEVECQSGRGWEIVEILWRETGFTSGISLCFFPAYFTFSRLDMFCFFREQYRNTYLITRFNGNEDQQAPMA